MEAITTDQMDQAAPENSIMEKNPLNIPEIRQEIFQSLNKKDLLRCRLVNTEWSDDGVNFLQSANYTIRLRKTNIKKHLNFLNSANNGSGSFLLLTYEITFEDSLNDTDVKEMLQCIDQLIILFGPNCIRKLDINISHLLLQLYWEQFISLIEMIGGGLKSLTIHEYAERFDVHRRMIRMHGNRYVETDSCDWNKVLQVICTHASSGLEHLHIYEHDFAEFAAGMRWGWEELPNLTSIEGRVNPNPVLLAQLVKTAPNLKRLALLGSIELDVQYRHTQAIFAFFNECHSSKTSMENIEYLEVGLGHALSYEAIKKFCFPKLKMLKLYIMSTINTVAAECLNDFLRIHCPALSSLDLVFACGFSGNDLANALPNLPALTHFGFGLNAEDSVVEGLCIDKFQGIPNKFPGLRSVSMHLGLCFYSYAVVTRCRYTGLHKVHVKGNAIRKSATQIRDWNSDFIELGENGFNSVEVLNFTMKMVEFTDQPSSYSDWQATMEQNMGQLRALFPNLKKLIIKNMVRPTPGFVYEKKIVRELLETFDGIEELEFQNYYEDWISQVIYESDDVVQNLKNIRRIRIPDTENDLAAIAGIETRSSAEVLGLPTGRPIVCLTTFLKYLPNLELFQIASSSLSTPWTEHDSEVENLRNARPNLAIEYL